MNTPRMWANEEHARNVGKTKTQFHATDLLAIGLRFLLRAMCHLHERVEVVEHTPHPASVTSRQFCRISSVRASCRRGHVPHGPARRIEGDRHEQEAVQRGDEAEDAAEVS